MKKRLVATLLILCMVLGMLPGTVWAAEASPIEPEEFGEEVGETIDSPAPQNSTEGIPYAVTGGNIYYHQKYFHSQEIIGCDRSVTSVDIPSSINGVAVAIIASSAFADCRSFAV